METIRNYLETMFRELPQNRRVLDAKMELLEMMEDKYNELLNEGKTENESIGIVISEFGNLDELSEVLGIKKDYENKEELLIVNENDAKEYLDIYELSTKNISNGVMYIIAAVAIFPFLEGLRFNQIISEALIPAIGVPVFLLATAFSVFKFINYGSKFQNLEKYEKITFNLTLDARNYVLNYRNNLNFFKSIAFNVAIIIISIIPLTIIGQLFDESLQLMIAVSIFLLMVSYATRNFIYSSMNFNATQVLLQEDEYKPELKENSELIDNIASIYWPTIILIYLIISFLTNKWNITWLIWPIAGIIFGIITRILNIKNTKN